MSHRKYRTKRRSSVGSVEQLDGRVLLTTAAAVQTIPVSAVVSPSVAQAYEAAVARVDSEFIGQAQALDNLVVARIAHYEAVLASGAEATGARVERVTVGRHSRIRVIRAPRAKSAVQRRFRSSRSVLERESSPVVEQFPVPARQSGNGIQSERTIRSFQHGVFGQRAGRGDRIFERSGDCVELGGQQLPDRGAMGQHPGHKLGVDRVDRGSDLDG